jgi:hypothetical protein
MTRRPCPRSGATKRSEKGSTSKSTPSWWTSPMTTLRGRLFWPQQGLENAGVHCRVLCLPEQRTSHTDLAEETTIAAWMRQVVGVAVMNLRRHVVYTWLWHAARL